MYKVLNFMYLEEMEEKLNELGKEFDITFIKFWEDAGNYIILVKLYRRVEK